MPKGSKGRGVFFFGVLIGSAAMICAGVFLSGKFTSDAEAWGARDIPFICLSNCVVVGPNDGNGPGLGNRLAGKDLSGAYINDFSSSGGNDFSRIILRGAYLPNLSSSQGDIWHNADFSNAWMQDANLDADFSGSNFSGVDLSNATLDGNFTNANFSGANFSNATLSRGVFTGANMNAAHFSNTTCPNGAFAIGSGCPFIPTPTLTP